MDDLFGFGAFDVWRLRTLLAAFEQGRLNVEEVPQRVPRIKGQDTYIGHITSAISAASNGVPGTGPAWQVRVDRTQTPPTFADTTIQYTVINLTGTAIPPGYYALSRDPTSGYFAVGAGGGSSVLLLDVYSTTPYQVTGAGGVTYTCYQANAYQGTSVICWLIASNGQEYPPVGNRAKLAVQVDVDPNGTPICICDWTEYTYGQTLPAFSPTNGSTLSVAYAASQCAVLGLYGTNVATVPVFSGQGFICFGDPTINEGFGDLLIVAPGNAVLRGATGTDGDGTQFQSGLCVSIGAGCSGGGSSPPSPPTPSPPSALGLVIDCGRWG